MDVDDLVSSAEIADRLGYANSSAFGVVRLRDPDFPEPVARLGKNEHFAVWLWPDVLEWAYRHGRLRPPKRRQRP